MLFIEKLQFKVAGTVIIK